LTHCSPKNITIVTECSRAENNDCQHFVLHDRANSSIFDEATVRPSSYHIGAGPVQFLLADCEYYLDNQLPNTDLRKTDIYILQTP
jgi:hypothetical protein